MLVSTIPCHTVVCGAHLLGRGFQQVLVVITCIRSVFLVGKYRELVILPFLPQNDTRIEQLVNLLSVGCHRASSKMLPSTPSTFPPLLLVLLLPFSQ